MRDAKEQRDISATPLSIIDSDNESDEASRELQQLQLLQEGGAREGGEEEEELGEGGEERGGAGGGDEVEPKKNVRLLQMLVQRNFIFPSNTIINVV